MPLVSDDVDTSGFVIYSIISPEYARQSVYVGKYAAYEDPEDYAQATVTISDSARTWQLKLAEPGLYTIDSTEFKPAGLSRYRLRVTTGDGQAFEAHTTVPDSFSICYPTRADTLYPRIVMQQCNIAMNVSCTNAAGAMKYAAWIKDDGGRAYLSSFAQQISLVEELIVGTSAHQNQRFIEIEFTAAGCDSQLACHSDFLPIGRFF